MRTKNEKSNNYADEEDSNDKKVKVKLLKSIKIIQIKYSKKVESIYLTNSKRVSLADR